MLWFLKIEYICTLGAACEVWIASYLWRFSKQVFERLVQMISKARVGLIHSVLGILKLFKRLHCNVCTICHFDNKKIWVLKLSGFQKNTHYLLLVATGPRPMYSNNFYFQMLIQFGGKLDIDNNSQDVECRRSWGNFWQTLISFI